jgi:hypothetical protein
MQAKPDGVGRRARKTVGRRSGIAAALAGVAYALTASFSHPFTVAADVVTAVPLAGAAALTVASFGRRKAETTMAAGRAGGGARWSRWWLIWVAGVGSVAAWELYCYAHLPREQHPTLSVLVDLLDSSRIGKTVAFGSWLALGWFLAAR